MILVAFLVEPNFGWTFFLESYSVICLVLTFCVTVHFINSNVILCRIMDLCL